MERSTAISTIRTLSTVLHKFSLAKHIIREKNSALSLLTHISTLFNTGMSDALDIAVTGHMSLDDFFGIIVVSSDSTNTTSAPPFFAITHVEPSAVSIDSLLSPSSLRKPNGPSFQQHLCDIAGILRFLSQTPDPDSALYTPLLFWLVAQCRKSIARRFSVGATVWNTPPWKILEDWKPAPHEVSTSPIPEDIASLREAYRNSDFPFPGDGARIHHWINCLGQLLSIAHELREMDDGKSLRRLANCLSCVDIILACPPVKDAFHTTESLSKAFDRHANRQPLYSSPVTSQPSKHSDTRRGGLKATGDTAEAGDEAFSPDYDSEEFDMTPGKDESPGAHALRYLSTLRAWHIAARSVIMLVRKAYEIGRTPGVSLVRLRDRSNEAIDDVRRNGQAIIDSLNAQIAAEYTSDSQEGKLVAQWMEKNCRIPERIRPFGVHSEAGLMALLKMAEVNARDLGDGVAPRRTIDFLSQVETCVIGLNNKCCYMCYLLADYMFGYFHAGSSKTIRLPGSHGHVFPWDPPSFGVPDAILVKLAQKLREDILRLATANARMIIDRSEHSNPERLKMPQIGPGWRLRVLAAFEKSTSRPRE